MPFRYVGKWEEGGQTIVFIADRARTYVVREPGPLTEDFSVEAIGEQALSLKATHHRTRLQLPYRVVAGAPPGAAGAAATEPDVEESN